MDPNPDEVERIVARLMAAVSEFGDFDGSDGLSAVLTFALRFATAVMALSDPASKAENVAVAARALRKMAGTLELEHGEQRKGTVH